jgi:uncharacterized protein with PQ loop repeat
MSSSFADTIIACWVVVFSPQIIENFRRSSAEGLSIEFVIIWLLGDFANIIGAVMQRVLPTMVSLTNFLCDNKPKLMKTSQIILAIYYTFADIVLLAQCFYYRGFHFRDPKPVKPSDVEQETPTERSGLLSANGNGTSDLPRTRSTSSFGERFVNEGVHMSPANPCSVLVVAAGIAGYYLSPSSNGSATEEQQNDNLHFNIVGQVFGYLCAALYLGSRIPQLLLNYRRKSTEGLNALFFLFACIGNLTYVLSIFAFNPICHHGKHGQKCREGEASEIYGRYILVNLSWLLGSLGTLFLDFGVFAQFFIYRAMDDDEEDFEVVVEEEDRGRSVQ